MRSQDSYQLGKCFRTRTLFKLIHTEPHEPIMSVPPEALQKVLLEMDNQLNKTRSDLSLTNYQLAQIDASLNAIKVSKTNLVRLCNNDERVWQGVGKAFVSDDVSSYLASVSQEEKVMSQSKEALEKKKHYLDTTLNNTLENMARIVNPSKN